MAYRLEKEANGDTAIVIDGWQTGMTPDPYTGMGKMLTADLSTPGEISSGYSLTLNTTSGGTLNHPIHRALRQTAGTAVAYFILDSASQVWKATTYNGNWAFLDTGNVTTGATATNQGLVYWIPPSGGNGWLFKFRNDKIDYLAAGTLGTWATGAGWQTITASVNHYAIAGQDGVVYFCNGAFVGSIAEVEGSTFDPTNSATYTFTTTALSLPPYEVAQSLAESGQQLLVGGSLNAIYPWDRLSTSFNYPLFIGDTFIDRMVTVNTNVYIFAGGSTSRGRIFVTNGSQVNLFYKIPDYITASFTTGGEQDPYFTWGDAMYHRNNLIFSFFMMKNGGGYITVDGAFGSASMVWAIDLETNAFRSLSQMDASSAIGRAGALLPALQTSPGFGYIVGVQDSNGSTSAAIDYSGTTAGVGRFTVNTDKIPVGTFVDKKTFSQIEFKLRTALESGESIAIVPVSDNVNYTNLVGNTVGSISEVFPINFEKGQWLQFWIQGIGNSASSGVRLKEIRIR